MKPKPEIKINTFFSLKSNRYKRVGRIDCYNGKDLSIIACANENMLLSLHRSLNLFQLIKINVSDEYLSKIFQQGNFNESYMKYNSMTLGLYCKQKNIKDFFIKKIFIDR